MSTYDERRHWLDTKMLQASNLQSEQEQQEFVAKMFAEIYNMYKDVHNADYLKLVNRLAAYKNGAYNDYIDLLAGAAALEMVDIVTRGNLATFSPKAARKRRNAITKMTGVQPIRPEEDIQS